MGSLFRDILLSQLFPWSPWSNRVDYLIGSYIVMIWLVHAFSWRYWVQRFHDLICLIILMFWMFQKQVPLRSPLLKVLSSEMDPAEIGSFDRLSLKREARRFFGHHLPAPHHLRALLSIIGLLFFKLPIRQPIYMSTVKIHCAPGLNLFFFNGKWRNGGAMANARKTVFAQFTKVRSIHRGFSSEKWKKTIKKSLFRKWQLIPNVFITFANPITM